MKMCIETGDKDAILRPQQQAHEDTWITLFWVLVIIGMIPVFIINYIVSKFIVDSEAVFWTMVVVDVAICFYLTMKDKNNYIKKHGGY